MPIRSGIGIDGCKGGWVGVRVQADTRDTTLRWQLCWQWSSNLGGLLEALAGRDSTCIAIDMPTGLFNDCRRGLEARMRRSLPTGRKSSVFPVPQRPTLTATTYGEACRINAALCGRALSKQSYFLLGKIRELDALLRRDAALQVRLYESHPELCFERLRRIYRTHASPLPNKRTAAGRLARMDVLGRVLTGGAVQLHDMLEGLPAQVARDDVVDAAVLAWLASDISRDDRCGAHSEVWVDAIAPHDECGLPVRLLVPRLPHPA